MVALLRRWRAPAVSRRRFNLVPVQQLPIVRRENVGHAEFIAQAVHMRGESVAARAAGYAMPGVVVDGNDAVALDKVARETVGRARAGGGPTLVEALTTRWRGHHEGDQQRYRPAGEADAGRDRDPIARLRSTALAANWLDEADLAAIDAESGRIVADALDYARASATPPPGAVAEGVYA
ncbi:MAG: thiamine pyrophosphate-dependent enzyme [Dehalococcoidia bacterium]